jgi:RNA polymerase sigma factor (sigma-70 family)
MNTTKQNINSKNRHLLEKLSPEHQARVDTLISENKGLIGIMIRQVFGAVTPDVFEELFADGLYSLWRAARAFDPSFGWKFSTLACTSLKRAMQLQKSRRMKNREHVADDSQWEAIAGELSDKPDPRDSQSELLPALSGSLKHLDPTTVQAITMRYLGEEYGSFESIAEHLGITREMARRICNRGLLVLRRHLERDSSKSVDQRCAVRPAG